jgi:hypothetical protein
MKAVAKLGLVLCLAGVVSFAENISGKLLDAACYDRNAQNPQTKAKATTECAATQASTSFAIQLSDGRVLKLDSAGNSKAMAAMKTSGGKASNASVAGTVDGQTVKVDDIDIE